MKETILYLIRHAEQLKECGKIETKEDSQIINEKIILSVKGEEEAKKISEIEELQGIDVIWSSHYVRAKQTAKYIAYKNNIIINIDENLGERKLGDLEKLQELGATKKNDYTTEQLIDESLKNVDGESRKEVNYRMTNAINNIIQNNYGKKIAIVSHGAAIKFFLMNWCTLDETYNIKYKENIIKVNSPRSY